MESSDSSTNSEVPLHTVESGLTTREKLEIRFKPTYKMRKLKNKGAIMMLVWNYLIMSMFPSARKRIDITGGYTLQFSIELVAVGLTLPIAGWLADVSFGRYKVVRCSMWIMWITYMLATLNALLTNVIVSESYSNISKYINDTLMIVVSIGLGAFQANIIHFGMDQLQDATTNEITSFIIWYAWTNYASGFVTQLVFTDCIRKEYEILKNLVECIHLSAALCLLLMFNNILVKEPVTPNPFKMVYNVIKYAIKTKHPQHRSAFTYCEDELPSRIDFGKSKYGGPFTTEQVEDVKTFLRFIVLFMVGSVLFSEAFTSDSLMFKLLSMMTAPEDQLHEHNPPLLHRCYSKHAFMNLFIYFCAFLLPVYEFVIYPVFYRILVVIESHKVFISGILLLKATLLSLILIETLARNNYLESNVNGTIPCFELSILSTTMDDRWMAFPYTFRSLSLALFTIGAIQFIASQAPYSMRGLLSGMAYGTFLLSATGQMAVSIPFTRNLSIWGTGIISCGLWHALTLLALGGAAGITLYFLLRKYNLRKRGDVLPNEHIFAERYYEVKS